MPASGRSAPGVEDKSARICHVATYSLIARWFIAANDELGFNQQQCIRGILVFAYTLWEDEIRPRLAAALGVATNEIKVNALGDLRTLRHCIIHQHGILSAEEHSKLLRFSTVFAPGKSVLVTYDQIHDIFVGVKQAVAELIIAQTGPVPGQPDPATIVDIAIPRQPPPR